MSQPIRFTENETGQEVLVSTTFVWGDEGARQSTVLYPSGRAYALTDAQLALHFTIVSPQEIFVSAFGGVDSRPTKFQKHLERDNGKPADACAEG